MTDTTIRDLISGGPISDGDLFISRQGTDTVDKSVTGSQIKSYIGSSGGTVTSVSVTTANGVSGSVATPTSTPAITLSLGAITPTSVAASGTVTGSNLSGTNTGDQTNITGNAGTATALQTGRTIAITGDLSYTSPSFNGTGNVTAAGTLATVNSNVGSFTNASVTVNAKGLVTAASSGTPVSPGGSTTQVQYNDSGAFAGDANFVWDKTGKAITVTDDSLGTTTSSAYVGRNTTAAAAGAQQVSPSIVQEGQGWKTNATAGSQSVKFQSYVLPVQGAANPTGSWLLAASINNAAYGTLLNVSSGGNVTFGVAGASLVSAGTAGLIGADSSNIMHLGGMTTGGARTLESRFYTNGGQQMNLTNTGLGIGVTGPSEKLHVVGNARVTGAFLDSTNTAGSSGQLLSSTATGTAWVPAPTGTVTSASVVSANGLAGTVATATTTPAITLSTTVTGIVKGNGTALSAASAGTDYVVPSGNVATATALQTGRTIAITGDLAYTSPSFDGTGNVTAAGTLATVNANTGSFGSSTAIPNFTVNGKGLITAAGTNAVIAPAGTLSGSTLNSGVTTSSLTSLGTQAQTLNMGSHLISNVTDPVSAQDAATKAYVDNAVIGLLDYRGSYDASTNLFPATGGSGVLGAVLKGDFWICSVSGTLGGTPVTPGDLIIAIVDTPGQTAANWDLIDHDVGTYVSSVSGTTNRITSTGGTTPVIDISSSYVGQASITTLGTVGTGTWNAGVIAGQYGGTGVANTGKAIMLGGDLTTSGAFATTLTSTATTNVTLPSSGTLYGTASGSITSAQLAGSLTDETGSGSAVFANSPTLVTPALGVATGTSFNGAAITSAGSATTYLNGAGAYTTPATVLPTGTVIKTFQTVLPGTFTVTGTTFSTITGLSQAITPTSSSNKVLVTVNMYIGNGNASSSALLKLQRGGTDIYLGTAVAGRTQVSASGPIGNTTSVYSVSFSFLDSPATTSATTYSLVLSDGSNNTVYVNRTGTSAAGSPLTPSSITVQEIQG